MLSGERLVNLYQKNQEMKSMLTILFALHFFTPLATFSQVAPNRGKQPAAVKVLPINDVEETSNGISGILKTKLALSDAQGPIVAELLTEFLKSKSGILSLAKSNPTDYKSKFMGIQNKLFESLKPILSAAQYTKFLDLKPKASDTANLLNHLFN